MLLQIKYKNLSDADGLTGNGTIPVGGIIMWSGSIASISIGMGIVQWIKWNSRSKK